MKFKLNIQNFGKIEQATIQINHLTVLAGQNNVGKSFVSKALYSFFHAMDSDQLRSEAMRIVKIADILYDRGELDEALQILQEQLPVYERFGDVRSKAVMMVKIADILYDRGKPDEALRILQEQLSVYERLGDVREKVVTMVKIADILYDRGKPDEALRILQEQLPTETINISQEMFKTELKQNFQISKLQQLKRINSTDITKFEIETIGTIEIGILGNSSSDSIIFKTVNGLKTLQKFKRVIYIESPVYWKLKSALEMNSTRLNPTNKHLSGVPNYFYDLMNLLKLQPLDEPKFKEILEHIEQQIGGRLVLSNDGNFVFQTQNEGTHALSITASGVANLGMIAMLLEKNLIDEGTFLFIDEPEAHLHPAWQVILMKALFELARKGVNVVITTHSIDMLKCLEVLAKEDEQAKNLIALNHLGANGHSLNEEADFNEKLNLIKKDLLEPFHKLYLEGL